MNATRTGFTLGVRRIRGIALALVLLAVLAAGAGFVIHAATTTTTVTTVRSQPAVAHTGSVPNPVGEGHFPGLARSAPNPIGEGHYPG